MFLELSAVKSSEDMWPFQTEDGPLFLYSEGNTGADLDSGSSRIIMCLNVSTWFIHAFLRELSSIHYDWSFCKCRQLLSGHHIQYVFVVVVVRFPVQCNRGTEILKIWFIFIKNCNTVPAWICFLFSLAACQWPNWCHMRIRTWHNQFSFTL